MIGSLARIADGAWYLEQMCGLKNAAPPYGVRATLIRDLPNAVQRIAMTQPDTALGRLVQDGRCRPGAINDDLEDEDHEGENEHGIAACPRMHQDIRVRTNRGISFRSWCRAASSASAPDPCSQNPDVLPSAMADTPTSDARLDRDLIVLIDHALAMVADHLAPQQRADLWQQAEALGLSGSIERQCSPEVQRVLLSERPRVNPDGGQVGATTTEHEPSEGVIVEEGSGRISSIPTS